jgi:YbbR domain-containing protein
VSRALAVIVHNWPLKLSALALAALLYVGVVLTQDVQRWTNRVPITPENLAPDAVLVSITPTEVTEIRYLAPADVQVTVGTFTASVDLSDVDASAGSAIVPVDVVPSDDRIRVLEVQPTSVRVELDPLTSKTVPVEVQRGEAPPGLEVGEPQVDADEAIVTGPASVVGRVVKAVASVTIPPSGLDVDQDVTLVPVDALGVAVSPVDVDPEIVRVFIRVGSAAESKSLPVNPIVIGTPAAGYEIVSISALPAAITVEGDADALEPLVKADTAPVSVAGVSGDVTRTVALALPVDVESLGPTEVEVAIVVRAMTATRTFSAGILLAGARDDRTYALSTDRVTVVIGGPVAELERLDPSRFTVTVDVSALPVGTTDAVPVSVGNLPAGLAAVSVSPATVTVTVGEPAGASPSPAASAAASPSPSPSS